MNKFLFPRRFKSIIENVVIPRFRRAASICKYTNKIKNIMKKENSIFYDKLFIIMYLIWSSLIFHVVQITYKFTAFMIQIMRQLTDLSCNRNIFTLVHTYIALNIIYRISKFKTYKHLLHEYRHMVLSKFGWFFVLISFRLRVAERIPSILFQSFLP